MLVSSSAQAEEVMSRCFDDYSSWVVGWFLSHYFCLSHCEFIDLANIQCSMSYWVFQFLQAKVLNAQLVVCRILSWSDSSSLGDWGAETREEAQARISGGIAELTLLEEAEHFKTPVDYEFTDYYCIIAYPIDLGTIDQRLCKDYYR